MTMALRVSPTLNIPTGVLDFFLADLGNMHQPSMLLQLDKDTEVGDIGDGPFDNRRGWGICSPLPPGIWSSCLTPRRSARFLVDFRTTA